MTNKYFFMILQNCFRSNGEMLLSLCQVDARARMVLNKTPGENINNDIYRDTEAKMDGDAIEHATTKYMCSKKTVRFERFFVTFLTCE